MADPLAAAPELKRLQWLVRLICLWVLIIAGRLAYLQLVVRPAFVKVADSQQEEGFDLMPPRGAILDRDGAHLAVSVPAWSLILNPKAIAEEKIPSVAAAVAGALGLNANELTQRLRSGRQQRRGFLRVKHRVTAAEFAALKEWKAAETRKEKPKPGAVEWMRLEQESWRVYPHGSLGAAVIGSVDQQENGYSGIEQTLQEELKGVAGHVRMLVDSGNRPVDSLERRDPTPGKDVRLTIDSQLQFFCDRQLASALKESGSSTGSIIVMNPHTGEIYAMAEAPTFDPNSRPRNRAEVEKRVHRAVGAALDGGSVMKMFTIAAALEHTRLRPNSPIDCGNGMFRYADQVIQDHVKGSLPMEAVLWKSSNVGAIRIGIEVGRQNLYNTLRDFGFGQRTGVELPGESAGILRPLDKWRNSSLYYVSIGHETTVTTMQLAQACSVIANGGWRVKPRLLLAKQGKQGQLELEPESPRVRVLKASTAVDLRKMSEGVVLTGGTGTKARIKGFTVGGKTGTAQLFDAKARRYVKLYSSSFMGYAPLAAPEVVVVVTLNGGKHYGGDAAAPVFSRVTAAALNMLGQEADVPAEAAPSAPASVPVPDNLLLAQQAQPPVAAGPRPAGDNEVVTGPTVPDFAGMDKRAVVRASAELGMRIEMSGAGLAREQFPAAGSVLALGSPVRVRFAR